METITDADYMNDLLFLVNTSTLKEDLCCFNLTFSIIINFLSSQ